jgi:hypothetical protein
VIYRWLAVLGRCERLGLATVVALLAASLLNHWLPLGVERRERLAILQERLVNLHRLRNAHDAGRDRRFDTLLTSVALDMEVLAAPRLQWWLGRVQAGRDAERAGVALAETDVAWALAGAIREVDCERFGPIGGSGETPLLVLLAFISALASAAAGAVRGLLVMRRARALGLGRDAVEPAGLLRSWEIERLRQVLARVITRR